MWAHPQVESGNSAGCRAAHSCDYIEKDEALYLFGGWSGKTALNDVWRFDLTTLEWRLVHGDGKLPRPRNNHASAVVDRKIYIHGGHDGSTWLSDFYVFDTETSTWAEVTTSGVGPSARACHTMSKVGGKLFVFGALTAHTASTTWPIVACRDHVHVDTLTWTHLASVDGMFPPGLRGHTANVKLPKVYFFGGYDGRGRSNELYILNTRTSMYIVGGFDGFKWLDDTHVLDICRIEEHAITMTTQRQLVSQYRELLLHQDATYSDITFL
ncbi:hypothetical protein DYB35_005870, partial [Aphanomyces astaci]